MLMFYYSVTMQLFCKNVTLWERVTLNQKEQRRLLVLNWWGKGGEVSKAAGKDSHNETGWSKWESAKAKADGEKCLAEYRLPSKARRI
jgi:hypothetical protein